MAKPREQCADKIVKCWLKKNWSSTFSPFPLDVVCKVVAILYTQFHIVCIVFATAQTRIDFFCTLLESTIYQNGKDNGIYLYIFIVSFTRINNCYYTLLYVRIIKQ